MSVAGLVKTKKASAQRRNLLDADDWSGSLGECYKGTVSLRSLSPVVPKEEIQGKWFTVAYYGKTRPTLIIGKVLKRFFVEEDVTVECFRDEISQTYSEI